MIEVTCAIIRNDENKVLVVQRGEKSDHPFKWEFPGGKINKGETPEDCIIREISEELSISIIIRDLLQPVEHDYGHKKIRLIPFICETLDELPVLNEHISFRWLPAKDLSSVDFCEADFIVAEGYLSTFGEVINPDGHDFPETKVSVDDAGLQSVISGTLNTKEVEWLADSAITDPVFFGKLVEYSFSPDRKLAFHSSWTLTKACDRSPELIIPYLPGIIASLPTLGNESAERSFLRIISLCEVGSIDKKYHGVLADHCFTSLRSGFSAIAIKAYSMEILYKLAKIYPEFINELAASINMLWGEGSAGILARGRIILKKLAL